MFQMLELDAKPVPNESVPHQLDLFALPLRLRTMSCMHPCNSYGPIWWEGNTCLETFSSSRPPSNSTGRFPGRVETSPLECSRHSLGRQGDWL